MPGMKRASPIRGFSLPELVLVLAILGITSAIALPRYSAALGNYRVHAAALSTLSFGPDTAVVTPTPYVPRPSGRVLFLEPRRVAPVGPKARDRRACGPTGPTRPGSNPVPFLRGRVLSPGPSRPLHVLSQ